MKSSKYLWGAVLIALVIAIGAWYVALSRSTLGSGREIHTVTEQFAGGLTAGVNKAIVIDRNGNVTKSPDGFMLWEDFTLSTTSPVRAGITNTGSGALMCDADSLYVYTDATDFAPSFKFVIGTTTTALPTTMPSSVGYSANLISSSTVATSTDAVASIASGWTFLLPSASSITLSVGDYSSAIASSTYYGNWSGQFGVHCWNLGQ